jgi:S1-C subfamily serine protease
MKKTKLILSVFILSLFLFLTSCSYFIPVVVTEPSIGTYSGEFYSYEEFNNLPTYISSTYSLTDINDYNDILLETKEHIIKSNILVETTVNLGLTYDSKSGSGFVFKEDDAYYYAVTNHHVISIEGRLASATYEIKTYEDSDYQEAMVVVSNEDLDLAVIRFEKNDRTEVEMIDISRRLGYKYQQDEFLFAIGNPLNLTNTVSFGTLEGITMIENVDFIVIQHTAEIYNGSSGGALVDVDGNLIGVNTWGLEDGNLSFAIPNFVLYNFLDSNGII